MEKMLTSRVDERGRSELVSEEAFEELGEAMKRGEIATIAQAHEFLVERGIGYSHPSERRRAFEEAQGEAEDG